MPLCSYRALLAGLLTATLIPTALAKPRSKPRPAPAEANISVERAWLHQALAQELGAQLLAEARVFDLPRPFSAVDVKLPEAAPAQVHYHLDDEASQHWQSRAVTDRREVFAALIDHTRALTDFRGVKTLAARQQHLKDWIARHGLIIELRPAHPKLPTLWAELAITGGTGGEEVVLARAVKDQIQLGVAAGPGDLDAIWRELIELAADRARHLDCRPERARELLSFAERYAHWIDAALVQRPNPRHRPCGQGPESPPAETAACRALRDALSTCAGKPAALATELALTKLLRAGTLPELRGLADAPAVARPPSAAPPPPPPAAALAAPPLPAPPPPPAEDPSVSFYQEQAAGQ